MNLSLTSRGYELWGSPRWVIYLAKMCEGWAYAGVAWLLVGWWAPLWAVVALCALGVATQKYVGHTRQWSGWPERLNWRDCLCDGALNLSWLGWFRHELAAWLFLAWLVTYPWSQE